MTDALRVSHSDSESKCLLYQEQTGYSEATNATDNNKRS